MISKDNSKMIIKKGDTVRFLNAVGGGVVVRLDESKKLVYVEDQDGFEIPVLERECVMVGEVNKETNFIKKDFKTKTDLVVDQLKLYQRFSPLLWERGWG